MKNTVNFYSSLVDNIIFKINLLRNLFTIIAILTFFQILILFSNAKGIDYLYLESIILFIAIIMIPFSIMYAWNSQQNWKYFQYNTQIVNNKVIIYYSIPYMRKIIIDSGRWEVNIDNIEKVTIGYNNLLYYLFSLILKENLYINFKGHLQPPYTLNRNWIILKLKESVNIYSYPIDHISITNHLFSLLIKKHKKKTDRLIIDINNEQVNSFVNILSIKNKEIIVNYNKQ